MGTPQVSGHDDAQQTRWKAHEVAARRACWITLAAGGLLLVASIALVGAGRPAALPLLAAIALGLIIGAGIPLVLDWLYS